MWMVKRMVNWLVGHNQCMYEVQHLYCPSILHSDYTDRNLVTETNRGNPPVNCDVLK